MALALVSCELDQAENPLPTEPAALVYQSTVLTLDPCWAALEEAVRTEQWIAAGDETLRDSLERLYFPHVRIRMSGHEVTVGEAVWRTGGHSLYDPDAVWIRSFKRMTVEMHRTQDGWQVRYAADPMPQDERNRVEAEFDLTTLGDGAGRYEVSEWRMVSGTLRLRQQQEGGGSVRETSVVTAELTVLKPLCRTRVPLDFGGTVMGYTAGETEVRTDLWSGERSVIRGRYGFSSNGWRGLYISWCGQENFWKFY